MNKKTYHFSNKTCGVKVEITKKENVERVNVSGIIYDSVDNNEAYYLAPAPAGHMNSFSGSGLPFPNEEIAYLHTPNKGKLELKMKSFKVNILMPNSYCKEMCNKLIEPTLSIKYSNGEKNKILKIPVGNRIPYRSQNYPYNRTSPTFYKDGWEMPIRSQEQILLDSSYPKLKMMSANHWGLKPSI